MLHISYIYIYTHQFINGAFIYSTCISAAVVLLYSPGFRWLFFFFLAVWNRPLIQRPSLDQSWSRLHASSCNLRASTFRLGSCAGRDHRRPTGCPTYSFSFCLLIWEKLWGGRPPPPHLAASSHHHQREPGLLAELDVIVQL